MTNKQQGFTLIELMVVIAIIGILTAVSFISFSNSMATARVAATKDGMNAVQIAMYAAIAKDPSLVISVDLCDDPEVARLISDVNNNLPGSDVGVCAMNTGDTDLQFSVTLPGDAGSWCVDTAGHVSADCS